MNIFKAGCLIWVGTLAFLSIITVMVSLWFIARVTSSIF